MPIQVVLVAETHYALAASVLLLIAMRDHVALQVRPSFEGFAAPFFPADVVSAVRVAFPQVAVEVAKLFEGFAAASAGLVGLVVEVGEVSEGEAGSHWC